jgi:hypothetical protein
MEDAASLLGCGATVTEDEALEDDEGNDVVDVVPGEVVCEGVVCPGNSDAEGEVVDATTPTLVSAVELQYDSEPAKVACTL